MPINDNNQAKKIQREFGIQPIDGIMQNLKLNNTALVHASSEQLTHKMLAKARKGRWLSPKIRRKILRALNHASGKTFSLEELFNY